MKQAESDIVQNAADALWRVLEEAPFVTMRPVEVGAPQRCNAADLVFDLELPGGDRTVIVEAKRSGQPRLARDAVNQLLRWVGTSSGGYGVFAAPYISPRGAEICRDAGVGYVDFSGNCRLCFDGVYIERKGNPNKFAEKRELRSLYAPKASRILRVLLTNPGRRWKVQEISREADVSLGHVSNVKQLLEDREWVSAQKEGMALTDPEDLLREWAENYSYRDNAAQDYYSMREIPDLEQQLAAACEGAGQRCAFTMFSGAVRLGVAARYKRVFAYVEGDWEDIASQVGLKRVSGGANVSLMTPYDAGVFYGGEECDGVYVPSAVQVFLDLKDYRGRGEETAEDLFSEVIATQW